MGWGGGKRQGDGLGGGKRQGDGLVKREKVGRPPFCAREKVRYRKQAMQYRGGESYVKHA